MKSVNVCTRTYFSAVNERVCFRFQLKRSTCMMQWINISFNKHIDSVYTCTLHCEMIKWWEILTWEWYSHSHDIFTHKISYNFFFNMIVTITDRCIQECKHEIQWKILCIVPEDHRKDKSPDMFDSSFKNQKGDNVWHEYHFVCKSPENPVKTNNTYMWYFHTTCNSLRGTKAKMFQVFNLFTYTVY